MQTSCSVDGCERTAARRGWCGRHYQRWYNHGSPTAIMNNRGKSAESRWREKVDQIPDGCWLWTGTITRKGYGMFWPDAGGVPAHRFAYELLVGPIPDGLQLDHLCRVRHCVNPAHLEPVTSKENQVRSPFDPAARTHCPHGHPYSHENTYVDPTSGGRCCRECARRRRAEYQQRQKGQG